MQKRLCHEIIYNLQWWIKNFSEGRGQLPKSYHFANILPKNCMKTKEFGPQAGMSLAPPLGSANDLEC